MQAEAGAWFGELITGKGTEGATRTDMYIVNVPLFSFIHQTRYGSLVYTLRFLLLILVLPFLLSFSSKTDNPDVLLGRWLSSKKKNQVQIYKHGNRYYGKLVWMLEPNDAVTNHPKVDKLNPDVSLRNRPLMNLVIVTNLQYKGDHVWSGGQIYNPEDGKTYGCEVTLRDPSTIDIHGYVMGMKFLGKTVTWTRVAEKQ